MWVARGAQPGLIVKAGGFDDQRIVSFPMADGVAVPGRIGIFGKSASIGPYGTPGVFAFEELNDPAGNLNELKRAAILAVDFTFVHETAGHLYRRSSQPRDGQGVRIWLVTLVAGIALALVVGYWLGIGRNTYLGYLVGLIVIVLVTLGMQRKTWILIPLTFLWSGSLGKLPIPLAPRDLAVLLAAASYVAYRVLSQENLRPKPHLLDLLVGLNVIYLALNLVKNPVGSVIFGSEMVGGRPIINICIALVAYWVMIRLPNSVIAVSRIPLYVLASAAVLSALGLLLYVVPSITPVWSQVRYSVWTLPPI